MTFCYSECGERFYGDFETPQAALTEAFSEDTEREFIYLGKSEGAQPASHYFNVDDMLERMAEVAGEDCGDVAEDWMADVTISYLWKIRHAKSDEERDRLQKVADEQFAVRNELTNAISKAIDAWAEKHGHQPTFWRVDNVIAVTREEFESGRFEGMSDYF